MLRQEQICDVPVFDHDIVLAVVLHPHAIKIILIVDCITVYPKFFIYQSTPNDTHPRTKVKTWLF
jgi:hypothetical protein